jgi:flagellar hook-associated protein 2
MTNSIFTKPTAAGGTGALSDLYTSVTKSLMVKNPGMKNLEAQLTRDSARLSTIGKLALALDQFRTSADRLSGAKLDVGASVSGNAVSAQVTDGKAAAGTHAIDVRQLAQGQQLASRALPDKGAAIGTGAVTMIKVDIGSGSGATSKTLRIDSGNNTLDGIAKALGQAGLDAKVVQDG